MCRLLLLWFLAFGLALLLVFTVQSAPDFDHMLDAVVQRGGAPATQRFQNWRAVVASASTGTEMERLNQVNVFFNRHIHFGEDTDVWGQPDYWATLLETLGQGRGDCEDFVIAKYFTLRLAGVAPERLRLVYVRARTGSSSDPALTVAHMVLAYYAEPNTEPLVLDNLITDIRPASRRPDLIPLFSFDHESVFAGVAGKSDTKVGGVGRLTRWEDVLRRSRAEGFK